MGNPCPKKGHFSKWPKVGVRKKGGFGEPLGGSFGELKEKPAVSGGWVSREGLEMGQNHRKWGFWRSFWRPPEGKSSSSGILLARALRKGGQNRVEIVKNRAFGGSFGDLLEGNQVRARCFWRAPLEKGSKKVQKGTFLKIGRGRG